MICCTRTNLVCCTRKNLICCTRTNMICTEAGLSHPHPWATTTSQSSPPPHRTGTSISWPSFSGGDLIFFQSLPNTWFWSISRHFPSASPFHLRSPSPHLLQPRSPSPHSPHLLPSPHHDRWGSGGWITHFQDQVLNLSFLRLPCKEFQKFHL